MGIKDIFSKIFTNNDKKVILCGLDYAGKSTMVSFLQTGTFIEHTPTMGKEKSTIDVLGIRINLIDMGGQKDFRALWLGEMMDAQCVIFMIDAADSERFKEAKQELWKLSSIFKKKPLIVIANKYDIESAAKISEIIEALDLKKLPSFEVLPVSCKTGYGIVDAFMKVYYKLTGKTLTKKGGKALIVFDQAGVPLTRREGGELSSETALHGGLIAAMNDFVKESFKSELTSLKLDNSIIVVVRSKYLMGSLVIENSGKTDVKVREAENSLSELLTHVENMCPELENNKLYPSKIDYLVQQYSTNLL